MRNVDGTVHLNVSFKAQPAVSCHFRLYDHLLPIGVPAVQPAPDIIIPACNLQCLDFGHIDRAFRAVSDVVGLDSDLGELNLASPVDLLHDKFRSIIELGCYRAKRQRSAGVDDDI